MSETTQQAQTGEEVQATLLRFVAEKVAVDGDGLQPDERLIESGRIDSLGLVNILAFVNETWGVDLMAVGDPRDFETIANLAAAVMRERAKEDLRASAG